MRKVLTFFGGEELAGGVMPMALSSVLWLGPRAVLGLERGGGDSRRAKRRGHARIAVCGWIVLLLALVANDALASPRASVHVESKESSVNTPLVLRVEFVAPGLGRAERYWPPAHPEFDVQNRQEQHATESQIDSRGEQVLVTRTVYHYELLPKRAGRLSIGPARFRYRGQDYETPETFVRVRNANVAERASQVSETEAVLRSASYQPPKRALGETFLYAVSTKSEVWVGEQFTVAWLLFTRKEVLRYEPTPPRLRGVWSETLQEPKGRFDYADTRVAGKDYVVALVSKRALFATEAGPLTVSSLAARVSTIANVGEGGLRLESNPVAVSVRPLPSPAPQGFDPSYVGELSLHAEVSREELPLGEALILTLVLRGEGALGRMEAPRLAFPKFRFDAPQNNSGEVERRGDTWAGHKRFAYWTTPSTGGDQVLPRISVPYFSPAEGRYKLAETAPIAIHVHADAGAAPVLSRDAERIAAEIRPQSSSVSLTAAGERGVLTSWVFWSLLLAPPLGALGLTFWRWLRARGTSESGSARARARRQARRHLAAALAARREERVRDVYRELDAAVAVAIDARVGRSVAALGARELTDALISAGYSEAEVAVVQEAKAALASARFSPDKGTASAMDAAFKAARSVSEVRE